MNDKLGALLKANRTYKRNKNLNSSKKYTETKKQMKSICNGLCVENDKYIPQKSVENINNYLIAEDKLERILYSEINSYISNMDTFKRGVFATNIEKLLMHSLDTNNNVNADCKKIIVKIYDHFHLYLNQIENINNVFANGIEETKNNLKTEIKGIEKEYISILGIFSSVVLAFVGGMAFSSSVLENINKASIYRTILIALIIGFVFFNIIYLMIYFICKINNHSIKEIIIICIVFNALIVSGIIVTCIAYKSNWFNETVGITEMVPTSGNEIIAVEQVDKVV